MEKNIYLIIISITISDLKMQQKIYFWMGICSRILALSLSFRVLKLKDTAAKINPSGNSPFQTNV
jgi:hypothetical protein